MLFVIVHPAPRSGLAVKNFIDVGAGVVDFDYRGNVGVVLFNHADVDFTVSRGDRVAQLILERISMAPAVEVQELSDTTRGAGGFGSTGVATTATVATAAVHVSGFESESINDDACTKRSRGEEDQEQNHSEVIKVMKLTELATVPTRGSVHAAGESDPRSLCILFICNTGKFLFFALFFPIVSLV